MKIIHPLPFWYRSQWPGPFFRFSLSILIKFTVRKRRHQYFLSKFPTIFLFFFFLLIKKMVPVYCFSPRNATMAILSYSEIFLLCKLCKSGDECYVTQTYRNHVEFFFNEFCNEWYVSTPSCFWASGMTVENCNLYRCFCHYQWHSMANFRRIRFIISISWHLSIVSKLYSPLVYLVDGLTV